jgi:hypothetical protein
MVGAGTYSEGISSGSIPSGMNFNTGTTKIIGAGSTAGTILRPTNSRGIFLYGSKANIEFRSLEIDMSNGPDSDWEGIELQETTHHIRFIDIKVHHGRQNISVKDTVDTVEFIRVESYSAGAGACTSSGDTEAGLCHGAYFQGSNILLDSCSLHDNNGLGVQWYPNPRNGVMRNCVVYNNRRQTSGGNAPSGVYIAGSNVKIYNNTVYNNEYIGIWCASNTGQVKNNISYSNGDRAIHNPAGCSTATNLTNNPLFVNPSTGDFRLQSSSAAINGGTNLSPDVTTDRDGISRPQGTAYDIGAYEYGSPAGTSLNAPSNLQVVSPNGG